MTDTHRLNSDLGSQLEPRPTVRSARSAWLALSAALVTYPAAIVIALGNQDDEWLPNLISMSLVLIPPMIGIPLGVRSARTGNRHGGLATALGSAWLTLVVMIFVGANYLWSGDSLVGPALLAIVLAGIVGGTVEAGWHRLWSTSHHAG